VTRRQIIALVISFLLMASAAIGGKIVRSKKPGNLELYAISPPAISNQTAYPVTIFGSDFLPGASLLLTRGSARIEVSAEVIDDRHLAAVIPPALPIEPEVTRDRWGVEVIDSRGKKMIGKLELRVTNDAAFPSPIDLVTSRDGSSAWAVSTTTDELWSWTRHGKLSTRKVGDGPVAMVSFGARGRELLVIAHRHEGELKLIPTTTAAPDERSIAVPVGSESVVVDEKHARAYVSNLVRDSVIVVDLEHGELEREIPAGVNPRAMALSDEGRTLWVSGMGSEDIRRIDLETSTATVVKVGRGAKIIGGHTESYSSAVMGGKPARSMVYSPKRQVLFAATIGPNIGPNVDRMEVGMNGGISVIDGASGIFIRHVSMMNGVPQELVLDDQGGVLYAADIATGQIVAFDADRLVDGDEPSRTSILATIAILPPADTPLIRPEADFGGEHSGPELHSGPVALSLAPRTRALFVLSRFTGTLTEIDTQDVKQGRLAINSQLAGPNMNAQRFRRLGEVIYYTDLGRTRMTCDTCHPDGRDGGVLFTKSQPIQIYRSPSIRSAPQSPPYFTPLSLPSLAATAKVVLGRNRFNNPLPNRFEISALTEYTLSFTPPPNPFRTPSGGLPRELTLPDGATGDALAGLAIFEGKGGCMEGGCHPAPSFTGDQDRDTRGQLHDVGTPVLLELRPELQDVREQQLPAPSLLGVWDNYPLLYSGAGGFDVVGEDVEAVYPFALRRVLELRGSAPHGNAAELDAKELNDLLAFLLTL
jgi:DNA-binding beta-propeller fold protein YncE